ncbi:HaaA family cyclophane-containing RiPP peptide [Streptomyces sp. NRRL S-337]|uniref:HaaA family cyclophane-containing RiPP peptide n=1 Tax=Streptomyces sp. NRRL S-337 TaxID=1463900 RepID=UPI0004C59E2D|nr:HaaA family cyclophane-containing RiPP peptide [Streptomyces sp. NRRL S-337]
MPPSSNVPSPSASGPDTSESAPRPEVLDRVAARVQRRLAAERAASNSIGDGAHAASLIWPWPL